MVFDPAAHPLCLYYLPNQEDAPNAYKIAINGTGGNAATPGDLVGYIDTGLGVAFAASADSRRFTLIAGGGVQTADTQALRHNVASYANALHENSSAFVVAVVQKDDGVVGEGRAILDNTNLAADNSTSGQGILLGTQNAPAGNAIGGAPVAVNSTLPRLRLKNTTATPIINLFCEEAISAATATRHVIMGYINPNGLSWLQTDKGRKSYGRVSGTAGSGNAAFGMVYGNRPTMDTLDFGGKLFAAAIYTGHPGQAEIDSWLERFPLGDIVGSPEARVGLHHINFGKNHAYAPYCHWFNEQRVSAIASSGYESNGGAVFNDGVSTDGGWAGAVHGSETVRSMSVFVDGSPRAFAEGEIYEGVTSVKVVRETTMGISVDLRETHTLTRNGWRYRTHMTRLGDSRTFTTSFYPQRIPRTALFPDYAFFDATGAILASGSVTAADATGPSGTVAIAQWNATTGQMALVTMTLGAAEHELLAIYSADARRVYTRLKANPNTVLASQGDTLEVEVLEQLFETDAESWQALARSELLATLAEGSEQGHGIIALEWAGLVSF